MDKFVSPPIELPPLLNALTACQIVIEIRGVDQAGPSFEARVFLNNPDAGPDTPATPEKGYAGSFHVYGYGVWPEQPGGEPKKSYPSETEVARAPITKTLIATDAIRSAAAHGPTATVTIVPILNAPPRKAGADSGNVLTVESVSILAKEGETKN